MIELSINPPQRFIRQTTHRIAPADHWDHFLARVGYRRMDHRIEPGLYAIGNPTPSSPVFVSANYTLSFDALRSNLEDVDGYILVLDTDGINVWCAAGKGTFGTDEIARRIVATQLKEIVDHRKLILPQLGAPGVSAHEVKKQTGFKVEYGPVSASNLKDYLKTGRATPPTRRVEFPLKERLVLIPIEVLSTLIPTLVTAVLFYFTMGRMEALAVLAAVTAGTTLFPTLLPWLPTHNFSSKGFFLGWLVALPFALLAFPLETTWWAQIGQSIKYVLFMPPITAFLALNFTGSSTFTSRSGVKREMFAYLPYMAWSFGIGLIMMIIFTITHWTGV